MTPNDWRQGLGIDTGSLDTADLVQILHLLGAAAPEAAPAPPLREASAQDRHWRVAGDPC